MSYGLAIAILALAALILWMLARSYDHGRLPRARQTLNTGGTPMNHDEIVRALHSDHSLEDGRATHRNVYSLRARRDETAARLALYPVPRTQAVVVPLPPRDPEPPRSAA